MIWLICVIGGLTALFFIIFFISSVWSKWAQEASNAGAYCMERSVDGDQDELDVEHQRYNSLAFRYHSLEKENDRLYQKISDLEARVSFSNPELDEVEADGELKRLRKRCFDLESQILLLEARVKWLGSNPTGE